MSQLNKSRGNGPSVAKTAAKFDYQVGVSANGNVQFIKKPAQQLYEIVTAGLLGRDSGSAKTSKQQVAAMATAIQELVNQGAYDYIANLAIHARTEMNIRTMPIVMVVQFAKALADKRAPIMKQIENIESRSKGMTFQKNAEIVELREVASLLNYASLRLVVRDVIQRADQITDLYAYALEVFGSKNAIPMAIKRGVGDAMNKFDEYAFGKYNRDGAVKFRDVLRIVHPAATTPEQGFIFKKIMDDSLATPYTWETQLSANGQKPASERKSNKEIWTELLTSSQLGYMALLRNMRNIHEAGVDADVLKTHLLDVISDPVQVARSKQLPFDLLQAYNVVKPLSGKMATAVSKALDASASNIPRLGDKIWLILDYSGSMGYSTDPESAFSSSLLLAASMLKANGDANNVAITLFGTEAKTLLGGVDTSGSVLSIAKDLESYRTGRIAGSTNFGAAIAERRNIGFTPDTVLVCTDGEVNGFPYNNMSGFDKDAVKVAINMRMADTTPMIKANGWQELSGWSTAIFKWIPAIREAEGVYEKLSAPYVPRVLKPRKSLATLNAVYESN